MMEFGEAQYYGALGIALCVATLIVTIQKVFKNFRKEREEYAAKVMQSAKEDDAILKAKLEAKIEALSVKINSLEESVNKDMEHLHATYTSEIKNLGDKIENLRDELRQQHSGLIDLLSKIVGKK
jgi:uncharacterized protein YlxW (UPF0749 family)